MEARYLAVKNWRKYQHYKDRRPPWIKLQNDLLDDRGFLGLPEAEQWQLVRIWLFVSHSEIVTLDDEGRELPVVAFDETFIRRGIASLKRVPLEKFVRLGWLIPLSAEEVDLASAGASRSALAEGAALAETPRFRRSPRARARATEVSERSSKAVSEARPPAGTALGLEIRGQALRSLAEAAA